MAYMIDWSVRVSWVGDGLGPLTQAPAAPSLKVNQNSTSGATSAGGLVLVPGGDTPTGGNFTTAGTTIGTNIGTILNAAAILAQIQGWATGTTQ